LNARAVSDSAQKFGIDVRAGTLASKPSLTRAAAHTRTISPK
jgi:hypothetical protein